MGDGRLETTLLVLNVVMGTAIVAVVACLADALGASRTQVSAAAFAVALWPNQLQQAQNLGSDIPAALLLAVAVLCLSRASALRLSSAGVAAGAGAACRSALVPAVVMLALLVWRRRAAGPAAAFLAIALIPLAAATAASVTHGAGWNIEGDLGDTLAEADWSFGGAIVAPADRVTPGEGAALYLRRVTTEPLHFVRQRAAALWELWGSWPYDNGRGVLRQIAVAIRFPLLALAAAGWYTRRESEVAAYAALSILALTCSQMMLFALVRYLVPMEPLAIALAASLRLESEPGP